jgi:hypothetical protein
MKLRQIICKHKYEVVIEHRKASKNEYRKTAVCNKCKKESDMVCILYTFDEFSVDGCNKKSYKTKKDAQQMLSACKKRKSGVKPKKIYHCKQCKAWHLTKK